MQDPLSTQEPDESGISEQCAQADELNKGMVQNNNSKLSYNTHPQAVYTSRYLNYKNLSKLENTKNYDIPGNFF